MTPSDRSSLVKLASSLPVGSPERKALLASLSKEASLRPVMKLASHREGSLEKAADFLGTKDRKFEELNKETKDSLFRLFDFLAEVQQEVGKYSGLAVTPAQMKAVRRKFADAYAEINEVLSIVEMAVNSDYSNRI